MADGCKISKVTSSCDALFVLFNLYWTEEEVEGESEAAAAVAAVTLVFMRVVIVELLADFSTPPDTNDVLDDDTDIGCCCKGCNWNHLFMHGHVNGTASWIKQ